MITWHYGSGFPKSLNIAKAIDKYLRAEPKIISKKEGTFNDIRRDKDTGETGFGGGQYAGKRIESYYTEPTTDEAKKYDGWGTALKPATEFWTMARKPISENTIAENVLKHSTGAININACRVELDNEPPPSGSAMRRYASNGFPTEKKYGDNTHTPPEGRYPANLVLDEFMAALLDQQSGNVRSGAVTKDYDYTKFDSGASFGKHTGSSTFRAAASEGGASRFFYCSKAATSEKNKGLEILPAVDAIKYSYQNNRPHTAEGYEYSGTTKNTHPTVKPVLLMQWLVKLVTPAGGLVLDPFNGSGTTGIACKLEGFDYIGIEQDGHSCYISRLRIDAWEPETKPTHSQLSIF